MSFSLNQAQRAKTRRYLGYFNLATRYMVYANIPVAVGQQEILEQNMRNILDQTSLDMIVELIECIEASRCRIKAAHDRLAVSEIAYGPKMNKYEVAQLWNEDFKICEELAHLLAVPLYWHPTGRGLVGGTGGGNISILG